MSKFKFNLQTVLDNRKFKEDQCLRDLAEKQRSYQQQVENKKKLINDLSDARDRRDKLGSSSSQIELLKSENLFIQGIEYRIIQCDQAILRANKMVEKVMRNYLFARRQRKMMDVLYEKDFIEYKIKIKKKEQKEIEDLITMRSRFKENLI